MSVQTFASVEESVQHTQDLFNRAKASGTLLRTKKQYYAVKIERIDAQDGAKVSTRENRAGEQAGKGDWIIRRLDDQQKVVIAPDGQPDQWVSTQKQMLKSYVVPEDTLEHGQGVVWTKQDGNTVMMVELAADIQIQTPWGAMNGEAGDYLANYDYDSVAGEPGKDYARVARDAWQATYELV